MNLSRGANGARRFAFVGVLAAALAAAGSAAPAEKKRDLDGYARIRFGMTLAEVRAARPEGEYHKDVGEYVIVTERADPGQDKAASRFRLRVLFNGQGRVERIVNENLLAAEAKEYVDCRALFIAMVERLQGQVGEPETVRVLNEPEFLFGQRHRARNYAHFAFANGATLDVYSVWDEYRQFTKVFRDVSCTLLADFAKS
ncbi:MAG: hypothetical protein IT563_13065 [Alphaproteobacteria bacterium]|nr:hypothetical protein [Alphaproteobacteria bacterium]